jgi:acetyl-CoA acetyltransferase family protein
MMRPSNFVPEVSPRVEYTTQLSMGQHCELLNQRFNVSRLEQDEFALRSHTAAAKATADGLLNDVAPVTVPKFGQVSEDNGIRVSTLEKMAKLGPAFSKDGSITAANASFFSDGAAVTLLMSEQKALEMGLKPKAVIKDWTYSGIDPQGHGLLLGPSRATARLLKKNKLSFKSFDVFEYHEAFSGQLIANLKAMDSNEFSKSDLELDTKLGMLPMEKLNIWGGSVSLGHPFGATGSRLVNMAANRLQHSNGDLALVAACAAGGLGHAMVLQRYQPKRSKTVSSATASH